MSSNAPTLNGLWETEDFSLVRKVQLLVTPGISKRKDGTITFEGRGPEILVVNNNNPVDIEFYREDSPTKVTGRFVGDFTNPGTIQGTLEYKDPTKPLREEVTFLKVIR